MLHTIENEMLTLTVSEHGAELWELRKKDGPDKSLLWDGKEEVWPRRAPVCFPWCGMAKWFEVDGKGFEGKQHGFIRDMEHTLVERGADFLRFRLDWAADETGWPWSFSFETCHRLMGNVVETTCTAVNTGDSPMPVQLGFHAGLSCPFTVEGTREEFQVRFEQPEAPGGTEIFPLNGESFANDSICFEHLKSQWIQVEEKATGRYLRVETAGWPYVLLWSKPGVPGFVCIEPWTGYVGEEHDLLRRPGAVALEAGETFSRTHRLTVGL